jgi:8-amino-7-oxononanoate synthase
VSAPTRLDPLSWLAGAARDRAAQGLRRHFRVRSAADDVVDLAGNDYLGLSRHPVVVEAAVAAVRTWGAGSTGSRLVTGTTELHADLDTELARYVGTPAALVCATGYAANLAVVTALSGPGSLVVSDAASHASLVDACRLSRARIAVVPHNDPGGVASLLAARTEERALVVTDTLFSVDGGLAPLAELHAACRQHGAVLVADEAHALGVIGDGRGLAAQLGLAGEPDIVLTASLSKSLGAQGGVVLGRCDVIAQLVDTARAVIFDTGLRGGRAGRAPVAGGAPRAGRAGTFAGRRHRPHRGGSRTARCRRAGSRRGSGPGRRGAGGAGRTRGAGGLLPAADRARGRVLPAAVRARDADRDRPCPPAHRLVRRRPLTGTVRGGR